RIKSIAGTVGKDKPLTVTFRGQPLDAFTYDVNATTPADVWKQNTILTAVINAWLKFDAAKSQHEIIDNGVVKIEFTAKADAKAATTARTAAMKYIEDVRVSLPAALKPEAVKSLMNRYRFALVSEVNVARKEQGLAALDPSPVLLAHPQLMDQRTN